MPSSFIIVLYYYKTNEGLAERRIIMMTEKIQLVMVKRKMSKTALAKSLNTSSANLSHKFKRDDFRESEIKKIAEVLNCTKLGFK